MTKLARVVGLPGSIWMGLGSILGTGVFVSLAVAASVAGSYVILAVVLAAILATANGLSSAQLAANHPVSGGTYEYGYRYLHPHAGFAAGWLFLVAKSASAATAALGLSGYFYRIVGVDATPMMEVATALGAVLVFTALVDGGIRRSNLANTLIVLFTITSLGLLILCGFFVLNVGESVSNLAATVEEEKTSAVVILHATALMFVAYTGYGRIATLGEEVLRPEKTIPRAIILTLFVAMVLYVGVILVAVLAMGAEGFAAREHATAPLEAVAQALGMPWLAFVLAAGAVTAMAGVLLNLILGLSRVLLAMSRRSDMPLILSHVDGKTQSPRRSIWVMGAVVAALVLVGDIRLTWSFSAFNVLLYYGITNAAALKLSAEERRYPRWIAIFGLITCLGLAFFVEWQVWLAGSLLLAVGWGLRTAIRKRMKPEAQDK